MFPIIISQDLYRKANNLTYFQMLPLKGTLDCVEVRCQGHARVLRHCHQHLLIHPQNKVQLINLTGNLY